MCTQNHNLFYLTQSSVHDHRLQKWIILTCVVYLHKLCKYMNWCFQEHTIRSHLTKHMDLDPSVDTQETDSANARQTGTFKEGYTVPQFNTGTWTSLVNVLVF